MTAAILEYFDAVFGDGVGKLHIACGWRIHRSDTGKFKHEEWIETRFDYPAKREQAARELAQSAMAGADVYVCPYLTWGEKRGKGTAIGHQVLHADVDTTFDLEKIHAIGGCAIFSGTPGHVHVYVQLARKVLAHQHTALERALVAYLGADAAKISDNDVLRPPGTLNRKPTVAGDDPVEVSWLLHPNGHRADPDTLAGILGATLDDTPPPPMVMALPVTGTPEPVSLTNYPTVLAALAQNTGDRSVDTARVIGAAYDAHLTLPQTRWVVSVRTDLGQRLAERRDDDVGITWQKIDIDRRQKAQLNYWGTGPAEPVEANVVIDEGESALEIIEDGFWDTRESLKSIWTTALAQMSSPWATLACCVARALAQVRPCVELPHLVNRGSLNWFGAIAAGSSGGKGAAGFAARLLVPGANVANLGSGEGMLACYGKSTDNGIPEIESVMFNVDEVDILTALGTRTASTTMSVLRSGFSGETQGFSYSGKDKKRNIAAGTYRMTLLVSVQPERAGGLFGDAGGGTPQRFMWFPGTDARITADPPWASGPLMLPHPSEWQYPREVFLPDVAKRLILEERAKNARGETDAMDGHSLFAREKFAYGLTVLDGRVEMTLEDWELSGIAAKMSLYTRTQVRNELQHATERELTERGTQRGIEMYAAKQEAEFTRPAKIYHQQQRIDRNIIEKVTAAGPGGIAYRDLRSKASKNDRDLYSDRLEALKNAGVIGQIEGTARWVIR